MRRRLAIYVSYFLLGVAGIFVLVFLLAVDLLTQWIKTFSEWFGIMAAMWREMRAKLRELP